MNKLLSFEVCRSKRENSAEHWQSESHCNRALTNCVFQLSSGVLRPNFLAMCDPDVDCSAEPKDKYQLDFVCKNGPKEELDARLSFPSGHATVVSYMAVFLIALLQKNPCQGGFLLLRYSTIHYKSYTLVVESLPFKHARIAKKTFF